MKKLLLFALVLALVSSALLPALAQCYRPGGYSGGNSYVAPVAPPKTYTTYSTYTAPSYNYNSYKSSYSTPSSSSPRSSYSTYSGSGSSAATKGGSQAAYFDKMEKADGDKNYAEVLRQAANVGVGELAPTERTKYYYEVMNAHCGMTNHHLAIQTYEECLSLWPQEADCRMHELATEGYYLSAGYGYGRPAGSYVKGLAKSIEAFERCAVPGASTATYFCAKSHIEIVLNGLGKYGVSHYDQALLLLNTYSKNQPGSVTLSAPDFMYQLARCQLWASGPAAVRAARYQQALASLAEFQADEKHRNLHNDVAALYAEAYYKLDQYAKSLESANAQLQIEPGNTEALTWRAQAHTALKQYPDAVGDWQAMQHYRDWQAGTWSNTAWARCLNNDFTGALADSYEALKRDSTTAASFLPRGCARAGLGQWAGALADYNRSLALDPKSGLAYLLRAQAYLKQNQKAQAKADLQQAVELGVAGHPTLTTADAKRLLAQADGSGVPAGKKPTAPARPTAKPRG